MPFINIPKTIELLKRLEQNDIHISCSHCDKKVQVKRCINQIILYCPECEMSFSVCICRED